MRVPVLIGTIIAGGRTEIQHDPFQNLNCNEMKTIRNALPKALPHSQQKPGDLALLLLPIKPLAIVRKCLRFFKIERGTFMNSTYVTQSGLVRDLRAMGLAAGDGVFVHASLRAIGRVVGGPRSVIAAFGQVVGPDGLKPWMWRTT
jgi:hypothetical protein